MNPKDVAKFGCDWIHICTINWFDDTFLVETITSQWTETLDIGSPFLINHIPREIENLFNNIDDCRKNGQFIPYRLHIMVYNDNSSETLISRNLLNLQFSRHVMISLIYYISICVLIRINGKIWIRIWILFINSF